MKKLIDWSLSQRLLIATLVVALGLMGAASFQKLPIDAFPDVSTTQVKIILKAPGMTPEEVEARVVAPIEVELLGIPHQRVLRSMSKYSIADVTLDFEEGTDIYWARQQVSERLNGVLGDLPAGVTGGMAPITTPLGEMLMFTIEGGDLSLAERRTLLDWTLRPQLRTVPGVADVNALGGEVRAFEVIPDTAALAARGIQLEDVARAIQQNNRNDGAGRLADGEEALLVRAEGSIKTLDDLRAVIIAERDAVPVRVGEVAQVRIGAVTRYGMVTKDGKSEAVEGLILGLRGANARQVVENVKAKLATIAPTLPPNVRIDIFYDRGHLVDRAINTVARALLEATVLVLVLLVLFLGDFRAAIVVATILPLAALATFTLMRQAEMSANLMSLGGLAIAIGMLVDGAVVVVENIAAEMPSSVTQESKIAAIAHAVKEVAGPVTSGIIIIAIVFFPLLTLEGLEGKLFQPVALSIVFALGSSLILSLFFIPSLASLALSARPHSEPWLMRHAKSLYVPLLEWSLRHGKRITLIVGVLLAVAIVAYLNIGKTFMPTMDEGDIIMQVEMLPSIGIQSATQTNLRIQQSILAKVPEVRGIVARTGADEIGLDPMGLNQSDVFLVLHPKERWRTGRKEDIVEALRNVMTSFPGINLTFTQPIEMRVAEMLTGVRGDLAIKIFGHEIPVLNDLARQIERLLRTVPGNRDVFTLTNEGLQYLKVEVNRFATGHQKLTVDNIEDDLRMQLEGRRLGLVLEGTRRTPLLLRGDPAMRTSPALFQNQNLIMPDGKSVPLATVARLTRVDGPVKIDRENANRYAVVQASVSGRDLVGFVSDAQSQVKNKIKLPQGYTLAWGGQFENQQRAAARLAIVIPIAIALVLILLYMSFGSWRQAAIILANIPFALIGGVLALWISREYLSVPASVGFIALLGIAVLNGVVLMSTFNHLRGSGLPIQEVVRQGAIRRLRPVLMTASITAFGLLPLLFATGPGSEIQRPLAIVVVGGLVTSTALTLLILPMLYARFCATRIVDTKTPLAQGEAS